MITTTNQVLHDRALLHRIALGRYSNNVVRRVIGLMNRMDTDVVSRLGAAQGITDFSRTRLEGLLSEIGAIQQAGWSLIDTAVMETTESLVDAELDFQTKLITGALRAAELSTELSTGGLTVPQVVAAVKARPFQGKILREWLTDADAASRRRIREVIRQGFAEGQTIDEMVRRIKGTRALAYKDGILEISRRGAETMVRTAITHTSSVAATEVYLSAGDLVVGIEWVATLDNRTTLICASRDGHVYPVKSGPRPPAHPNCRSTTIPRLRGMVPFERQGYQAWFSGQPAAVQDDILGPTKGALYRRGGMTLDRFVDRAGVVYTLDDLRRRDAAAFDLAGI